MVEVGFSLKSQSLPEHWSQFLRCTICFGYLREPHSLVCGHTFCKKCLKRLAEIAKDDNPTIRVRRLSLSCPTCRHPFPAKPVLGDKLCTNIVLKHMVELWKREYKMLSSCSLLTERSICCQTRSSDIEHQATFPGKKGSDAGVVGNGEDVAGNDDGGAKNESDVPAMEIEAAESDSRNDLQEEFTVRVRPLETYNQLMLQTLTDIAEDFSESTDTFVEKATFASSASSSRRDNISSESESSVTNSEQETSQASSSISTVQVQDLFMPGFPHLSFHDCSPGRFLLMAVWCMYSVVIVGLAETFLPYVILFTLFFFLIVLG